MSQSIKRIDLGGVNSYVIEKNGSFMLVDAGGPMFFDKGFNNREECLSRKLDELGINSQNLKLMILTHGDLDHVYNVSYLREKYRAPVAMHRGDVGLVEEPKVDNVMSNCKYSSVVYKVLFRLIRGKLKKLVESQLKGYVPFQPDIVLEGNESLDCYGFEGQIYHVPGHTKGSIAIHTPQGDLICGDIYANIKKPDISPNAEDFNKLIKSCKFLDTLNTSNIYPGHGNPYTK